MKITEINSLSKYLLGAKIIGVGTTAICFLLSDKRVLKLYYNSYNKKHLFYTKDMTKHLEMLGKLTNETYIGPNEILISNNEVIGYLYPYINAKTLKHMKKYISLDSIINKYKKLEKNTKEISTSNFLLRDLHDRNILIDKDIYIIDLDRGYIDQESTNDKVYTYNMREINKTIIDSLFNVKDYQLLEFTNLDIQKLYKEAIHKNPEAFIELLIKLDESCNNDISNSHILKKKVLYTKKENTYYRPF